MRILKIILILEENYTPNPIEKLHALILEKAQGKSFTRKEINDIIAESKIIIYRDYECSAINGTFEFKVR